MSDEQPKKRHRRNSLARQLQEALTAARELDTQPANELTVTRSKLVQTRLIVLAKMQVRERFDKIRKLKERLATVEAENHRLTAEVTAARAEIQRIQTMNRPQGFGSSLDEKLKAIEVDHYKKEETCKG